MSEKPDVSRETLSEPAQAPKRDKRSSVYIYLAVLFGAAFLMLLLAYFVQRRNNETALSDLRISTNATREELLENIKALEEEKTALEAQVSQLTEDLRQEQEYSQEFQTLYDGAQNTAAHLEHVLYGRTEAMELFYQLDGAYTQGDTQRCLELIQWMEKPEGGPLKDFLPNGDDRGQYSFGVADGAAPAERYQEIADTLSYPE